MVHTRIFCRIDSRGLNKIATVKTCLSTLLRVQIETLVSLSFFVLLSVQPYGQKGKGSLVVLTSKLP